MLKHRTKYVTPDMSQGGADAIDRAIEQALDDMKDVATGKYPRLVTVALGAAGGDRVFVTVLAEG